MNNENRESILQMELGGTKFFYSKIANDCALILVCWFPKRLVYFLNDLLFKIRSTTNS